MSKISLIIPGYLYVYTQVKDEVTNGKKNSQKVKFFSVKTKKKYKNHADA